MAAGHRAPNGTQLAKRCESFTCTTAARQLIGINRQEYLTMAKCDGIPAANSWLRQRQEIRACLEKLVRAGNHVRACTDAAPGTPKGA